MSLLQEFEAMHDGLVHVVVLKEVVYLLYVQRYRPLINTF